MSTTSTTSENSTWTSVRTRVQKFGTALSNMIMPNIGAFIAWGLITALFIEVGWFPVPELGGFGENADGVAHVGLVGPMITYMLPIMIAHSGGAMVYGTRGAVVGVIATMGVIVGSDVPMFIGAMGMGPLGGWLIKKWDGLVHHRIRPGFEMLVNNFSAGILGGILAVFGFYIIGPLVTGFSDFAAEVVNTLVNNGLLPLTSVFIEPAKILFLNNAINHGILTPLGTAEVAEAGKSVLFLLEANPGPGLGILLGYWIAGTGVAKASAPGAIIIQFFGGIHEIYFPYVLMKPILVLAAIAGGMTGVFINVLFSTGLVGPAAPGSIFAVWAVAARGDILWITVSVLAAAAVSGALTVFLLRVTKDVDGDLASATSDMETMKGKKSSVAGVLTGTDAIAEHDEPIRRIVFACDAGMGSSAMGASLLRRKVHGAGYDDVEVTNKAISDLQDDWDLVVSHQDLTPRAAQKTGSAVHVSVDDFMNSPKYDEIVEMIRQQREGGGGGATGGAAAGAATATAVRTDTQAATQTDTTTETQTGPPVLTTDTIVMDGVANDSDAAIDEAGALLMHTGAIEEGYIDAMHQREASTSTAMGNGLAIPHGTNEAKGMVERTVMSVVKYPQGLDWNGKPVTWVVGIAGRGNEHLSLLAAIAGIFTDDDELARLNAATTPQEVLDIFEQAVV
ncbi:PTS mannitol transporter subunit IICBA [Salsipaludibacter albus]|uniref:PTS mannitol transporter subunit IICBA n=1 Tax=Salsipaludibacter albus TaxID=2849650 RepID=UPI001EE44C0D|nr:PTS mannitol transporter subunit IICBA [Salsipaludibacter albus]MBY5161543.1 PTS mannitol transporter subunit IICBA [Salsipaludibacter albus]